MREIKVYQLDDGYDQRIDGREWRKAVDALFDESNLVETVEVGGPSDAIDFIESSFGRRRRYSSPGGIPSGGNRPSRIFSADNRVPAYGFEFYGFKRDLDSPDPEDDEEAFIVGQVVAPKFLNNPRDIYEQPELVDFNEVYTHVGFPNTYVFLYLPLIGKGIMREMGGIEEPVDHAPDEAKEEAEDLGNDTAYVDYNHHLLWETFESIWGSKVKGKADLYDTYRGYWIPDEGTLAFYKEGARFLAGGTNIPSPEIIETVLDSLDPKKERPRLRLSKKAGVKGINEEEIDVVRVIK